MLTAPLAPIPTTANLIRVTVGPVTLVLDMARVRGIERADRIRDSADRPGLSGEIVNRFGRWPVLDLAAHLGGTSGGTSDSARSVAGGQVVLTESAGQLCGLLVDRVSPANRMATAVRPVPTGADGMGPYDAVVLLDDEPFFRLDPDQLFHSPKPVRSHPRPLRTSAKPAAGNVGRMVVFGHHEYPLPGGRMIAFGLPAGCVTEIVDLPAGSAVPVPGGALRRLTTWRDAPLALLDVAAWVGLPGCSMAGRRAVIVRTGTGEPVGFSAGAAVRMVSLPLPSIPLRRELPFDRSRVAGAFELNEFTLLLPDPAQLTAG